MWSRRAYAPALAGALWLAGCSGQGAKAGPPAAASAAGAQVDFFQPPGLALESTCVTTGPEICFDGIDNNCNGLLEEGCGVASGKIQIAAAWTEDRADVDLLVTDPNGELARPGASTAAGMTKDRDCGGADKSCAGRSMENVFLQQDVDPVKGTYKVVVRLEKSNGAALPVRVHLGARVGPRVYGLTTELGAQEEEKVFKFRY